jgi:hypothetical protein
MKLNILVVAAAILGLMAAALAQTAPTAPSGPSIVERVDAQMKACGEALKKDPTGNACVDQAASLAKALDEERVNADAAKLHPISERVTALYKLLNLDAGLILDPKTDEQKANLVKQVAFTLGAGKEAPAAGTPEFDRLVKFGSDFQTMQRLSLFKAVMASPAADFEELAKKVSGLLPDKPEFKSRAALLKATLELAKAGKLPK